MRKRFEGQLSLGQTAIDRLVLPAKSRDERPAILAGLQWIFITGEVKKEILDLLEKRVIGGK